MSIGGDLYTYIFLDGVQKNTQFKLVAQESVFVLFITSPTRLSQSSKVLTTFYTKTFLDKQLTRFSPLEELPERKVLSADEVKF